MTVRLRPAFPIHAGAMAALHAVAFPPAECWSEAIFATQLLLPGVFGLLAEGAGCVLARVAADESEILTLAVIPAARRAGLGRALLAGAETEARAQGAVKMYLEVDPANEAARALYAGTGYAEVGRRPRYYPDGSDALVLARPLSPAATRRG